MNKSGREKSGGDIEIGLHLFDPTFSIGPANILPCPNESDISKGLLVLRNHHPDDSGSAHL
jgi:hypothetical protein